MTAFAIFAGIGFLILALVLHLVLWRFRRVRREMFWLFVLFFVVPLAPLAWLYGGGYASGMELLAAALLWLALASAYVQTYPVLRHVIPSFRILLLLDRHRSLGLRKEEITHHIAQEGLFAAGLGDLESDSLITQTTRGRYVVTRSGAALARAFGFYRRLLGLGRGLG